LIFRKIQGRANQRQFLLIKLYGPEKSCRCIPAAVQPIIQIVGVGVVFTPHQEH
jgi:hypothetical protein